MKRDILVIDSTLRDGSHAISHQMEIEHISAYANMAEIARVPILMVGHGNGLGASSLQLGQSKYSDRELLTAAKNNLKKTKLGAFLIPGFGTIKRDIAPAISLGVQVVMVGTHCTEATVTRQHIQYCVGKGIETYGVLMMSHMVAPDVLLEQAKLMEGYGAVGILLMDSAGAYLPTDVAVKVKTLVNGVSIPVGFHAHNNLGMAVANSLVAVEHGATILDATSRGFGAGAGNCQLEVAVAVLQKMGYNTGVDLYTLMDMGEYVGREIMKKAQEINVVTLTSGLSGVFSGFAPHAVKAAKQFDVDVRDIFMELGRRGVVGGQEDIIVDVAMNLKQLKEKRSLDSQIGALT
jgi:4-hydroxy 2-oxovalerate aldolase